MLVTWRDLFLFLDPKRLGPSHQNPSTLTLQRFTCGTRECVTPRRKTVRGLPVLQPLCLWVWACLQPASPLLLGSGGSEPSTPTSVCPRSRPATHRTCAPSGRTGSLRQGTQMPEKRSGLLSRKDEPAWLLSYLCRRRPLAPSLLPAPWHSGRTCSPDSLPLSSKVSFWKSRGSRAMQPSNIQH